MQNTMGKRVDEEREEKSRNRFTIRKPSRQATQQNDDFFALRKYAVSSSWDRPHLHVARWP
jgi:hypothetical protein